MHQQRCGLAYDVQVFDNDDFPPDAEFGCFHVVMGPSDTDFANDALIRLDVGKLICALIRLDVGKLICCLYSSSRFAMC